MKVLDWAASVKPDLVRLQRECGIPALWAAAQMCHESATNGGAALSTLATEHNNYAGMKFADWQRAYGAKPVNLQTNEVVDGEDVQIMDAFAAFPSWADWLQAYRSLLMGTRYRPALQYSLDPMLYGVNVALRGWATDPKYVLKVAEWMGQLWPVYVNWLAGMPSDQVKPVPIRDAGGSYLCSGFLLLAENRTYVQVRELVGALGLLVDWDPQNDVVTVKFPGKGLD